MPYQLSAGADRRDRPKCGREIMAAATKCGFCWERVSPVEAGSVGTRVGRPRAAVSREPVDESCRVSCPRCGRRIMAAATVCGFCWTKLAPPPPTSVAATERAVGREQAPDAAA